MRHGDVQVLVVLGGNPVYTAPMELDFPKACEQVGLRVHLSPYFDETSFLSHWHVPAAHDLGPADVRPIGRVMRRNRSAVTVGMLFP
jgi:anaerobic selenocysteine-containing dehydrogenase